MKSQKFQFTTSQSKQIPMKIKLKQKKNHYPVQFERQLKQVDTAVEGDGSAYLKPLIRKNEA